MIDCESKKFWPGGFAILLIIYTIFPNKKKLSTCNSVLCEIVCLIFWLKFYALSVSAKFVYGVELNYNRGSNKNK